MTLGDALSRAVETQTASMTPARREGFEAGVDFIARSLVDMGFERAVGERLQALVGTLNTSVHRAESAQARLQSLAFSPDHLDEKAVRTLALTGSLLQAFTQSLGRDSLGQSALGSVSPKIVTAVSYIVWAYLANGAELPHIEQDEA